jgi:flagellar motor component MotA
MLDMLRDGGWPAWLTLLLALGAITIAIVHAALPQRWSFVTALGLCIGTVAVGLLGTVLGLIHSFAAVAGVDPSMKATLLAKGISEAMNCTAIGLGAVPFWLTPFIIGIVRGRRQQVAAPLAPPPGGSIQR